MKYFVLFAFFMAITAQAKQPTSIIFVIGDGMGTSYTSAYRYFTDNPQTATIETTIFDDLLTGTARTYPASNYPAGNNVVTDSAAAATALATGVKTYNGAIGVDMQRQPLLTLLEAAKARGYQTAMLATSSITHATPASFAAHVTSRKKESTIADQYFDQRIGGKFKIDLLLGGGQNYFKRADRNLIDEFKKEGYSYISQLDQLDTLNKLPALGLFAANGLPLTLNNNGPLMLSAMTTKALSLLDKKPFFLLIEASQIDWCGHANDIACAMAEMRDMAAVLTLAKAYVDRNKNTVLVATADHATGGLSIGANDKYKWGIDVIKNIKASATYIADNLLSHSDTWQKEWLHMTAIKLHPEEIAKMQQLLDKARAEQNAAKNVRKRLQDEVITLALAIINERSYTGWTTRGHTGEDVPVFSYGKGKESFRGNMDNTDIAKQLFKYLPVK